MEEHITAEGSTLDDLLYNFLSEVLFIFDAKGLLLNEFDVTMRWCLKCREGREVRCHALSQVGDQGVTYHML